ncbi:MAG: tRNA (N(6)-L-threonylcarbamoyladenosine(37)-C(2))-methylthiotransferase MtaB [Chloroflexota bacterium]|nr:tRNA (N(6)-L-threonylcarbamoyladenosine(37)-C(2))-methylthiotransferase MtaB [Chloroflexota bacterium]
MNIYLDTLGCRLNFSEMETLGRQLQAAGHFLVATPEAADVCVLNTCTVTAEAARKSRQMARRLARHNPSARLAVTGCYATLAPETVVSLPNVHLVVDNQQKENLDELLQPWSGELDGERWRRLAPEASAQPSVRTRAFVKVQDGCNNSCTFCIVTVARGQERSRRVGDIVADIQRLGAEGYQEAVLTGVHLGGYGRDLGTNLHELTRAILSRSDLPRLRLSSLELWDLEANFFDLWSESGGRLCAHLHLPLQAGCDRTLKRMARRNRTEDFRQLVDVARARIPGLVITTDLIVGFPGETEADFEESCRFAADMRFAHIHVFPYSARQGTAAAGFSNQVPVAERRRRVASMQALALQSAQSVRESFLGTVRPVLWESHEFVNGGTDPVWRGLTDNYLRVETVAPSGMNLENKIEMARLHAVNGTVIEAGLVDRK